METELKTDAEVRQFGKTYKKLQEKKPRLGALPPKLQRFAAALRTAIAMPQRVAQAARFEADEDEGYCSKCGAKLGEEKCSGHGNLSPGLAAFAQSLGKAV